MLRLGKFLYVATFVANGAHRASWTLRSPHADTLCNDCIKRRHQHLWMRAESRHTPKHSGASSLTSSKPRPQLEPVEDSFAFSCCVSRAARLLCSSALRVFGARGTSATLLFPAFRGSTGNVVAPRAAPGALTISCNPSCLEVRATAEVFHIRGVISAENKQTQA